ncbi:MAG: radical SAM protein [candidate division WOR-3 bacterium]
MKVIYTPTGRAGEYAKWAVNLYTGCSNGCIYCYVPKFARRSIADFRERVVPRSQILSGLKKDCEEFRFKGHTGNVLLCFLCDPYPRMVANVFTRQVLEILSEHGIKFTVLTKNGSEAVRDFDLYKDGDEFATTLTFIDDKDTAKYEPNADKYSQRVEALRVAKEKGIKTWVSLEPVIKPGVALEIIKETHTIVDEFRIGKLNHFNIPVDWRRFKTQAEELCCKLGVRYLIKKDLSLIYRTIENSRKLKNT